MKRIEADSFLKELKTVYVEKPNKFLLYAIQKTISNLDTIVNDISTEAKKLNTQEFFILEKGRRDIVVEYAEKGSDGNPIVEGNYFKIDETKKAEFTDKLNSYQETNKELIEKYNILVDEFDKYLGEEIGDDFIVKVSIKNFPDFPGTENFRILSKLIKENTKEIVDLSE